MLCFWGGERRVFRILFHNKKPYRLFYMVGYVSGPIGRPMINQPTTISTQTTVNNNMLGIIIFRVPNTVILTLCLLLYFSKNANITMKYMKNGVIPFPMLSAALKMNWVKSGVMFAFMNSGTSIGDASVHLVTESGINMDISIIMINMVMMSGIPVNSSLSINVIRYDAMTSPMFVKFKMLTINDTKNIRTNMYPRLSNSFDNPTLNSLVFLKFSEMKPYMAEQIISIISSMNIKASVNGASPPSSWAT